MPQSRREFLGITASVLAFSLGAGSLASQAKPQLGLKDIGRSKGIEIAAAFNGWFHEPLLRLLIDNCDVITPENAMKAANISTQDGKPTPAAMDQIAAFCAENDLKLHGHTLFWHQSLPHWLEAKELGRAKRAHRKHLRFVMPRYPHVVSWDVVSEVISDETGPYRSLPILDTHGDEFVAFMFKTAREFAPAATLVINEYNLSCGAEFCDAKRGRMLAILERLLRANVPIDAVGIQAHLAPRWPVVPASLEAFLRDVTDLGLAVFINELDVNDIDLPADIATRDRAIAQIYADYLDTALAFQAVKRLGFWGLTDKYHWIVEGYAPFRRTDGTPRPAMFDQELQPKPAYFAVRDALLRAPARAPSRA